MATITKVVRTARGKTYEYHAVRFTDPGTGKEKLRYFRSHKDAARVRTEEVAPEARPSPSRFARDRDREGRTDQRLELPEPGVSSGPRGGRIAPRELPQPAAHGCDDPRIELDAAWHRAPDPRARKLRDDDETVRRTHGGSARECRGHACGCLRAATGQIPDKRFSVSREVRGKSLIVWLPGLESNQRPTD
jgi:hypothetical protein